MKETKNLLVITSGGLSPSLNPTLYGVISEAKKNGYNIYGGVSGWVSVVQHGKILNLNNINLKVIKKRGGSFLRSSRTNPLKVEDGLNLFRKNLLKYKINGIIAIGGDDTLGAVAKLYQQEKLPIVGLPKTVDNDLPLTYFSPGFPSAAYYTAKLTAETKQDSAYTYSRVYIIEMYGAKAGWLTCATALGGADVIIPPEWKFDLKFILRQIQKKYEANGNYCVVAISKEANITGLKGLAEKQFDGFGNTRSEFICLSLQQKIQNQLGLTTKIIIPMNYVQSGDPIKLDVEFSHLIGKFGFKLIKEKKFGQAAVIKFKNGKFSVSGEMINKFLNKNHCLDNYLFNKKTLQPTAKYLKYLKNLIGNYNFIDQEYLKIQNKICRG